MSPDTFVHCLAFGGSASGECVAQMSADGPLGPEYLSAGDDPRNARLTALPRERYLPLLRADRLSLQAMFEELEARHGSVLTYLDKVLGVGALQVKAMRATLLEQ